MPEPSAVNPFFLLGSPRSGTTLLRLMLNAHPKISVPPECGFALWLAGRYSQRFKHGATGVDDIFLDDLMACRKFETWQVSRSELEDYLLGKQFSTYAELAAAVYRTYAAHWRKSPTVVGDKNNYYIGMAAQLRDAFPEACVIHIVRDGRDVYCSHLSLQRLTSTSRYRPSLETDIARAAFNWRTENTSVVQHFARRLVVRYEQLVEEPARELAEVCRFLGVGFDDAMLAYQSVNDEPEEFMHWKHRTRLQVDRTRVGRFLQDLNPEQISIYNKIAGPALASFGYLQD